MLKKTPIEMERHRIAKVTRSLIRLKHSLRADEEINNILPESLEEFDQALNTGELKQISESLYENVGEFLLKYAEEA